MMRRWIMVWLFLFACAQAQVKWDGGANTLNWRDAMNWSNDQVPAALDLVILDNSIVSGSYEVILPPGTETVQVMEIKLDPSNGATISLVLPASSTAAPALTLNSTLDALDIGPGASFINASGATSGAPVALAGRLRIRNGGRYIHRTARPNAGLIDKLSTAPGTETGIWEFDVPGTAGYTVSLTGNSFGSLHFSAASAGGTKSYSGSGTSALSIRGDLIINPGAQVTSTLTADILLAGNLQLDGRLQLHPVTSGTSGRSLVFNGKSSLSGSGILSMNAFFRNILVPPGSSLQLQRPLNLPLTPHSFICQGKLLMGEHRVEGEGSFILEAGASIATAHPEGFHGSGALGCVRTSLRSYSTAAGYVFNGDLLQSTGPGCPDNIAWLEVNNPSGLLLSQTTVVRDSLVLTQGIIRNGTGPATTLTLTAAAAVRSRANTVGEINTGWEESFVDGPVLAQLGDTSWRTLPLGHGTAYLPLRVQSTGTSASEIRAQYLPPPLPGSFVALKEFVGGYWKLASTSGSFRVALPFRAQDRPQAPEVLTLAVLRDPSASWMGLSSSGFGPSGPGWLVSDTAVTVNTVGSDTVFHLARAETMDALLPLEPSSFDARQLGSHIQLNWIAHEDGLETTYKIERSNNGVSFTTIGYINSKSPTWREHQFRDETPFQGVNYYRLRILSGDQVLYSRVVRVVYHDEKPILYPNPAQSMIQLRIPCSSRNFSGQCSKTELIIVNYAGTVVRRMFVNTSTCQIRVSDLPSGLYLVKLIRPERSFTLFFTKY